MSNKCAWLVKPHPLLSLCQTAQVQAAFCVGLLHPEGADRVIPLPSIKYGLEVVLPTLAEIPQSQALLKEEALLQPAKHPLLPDSQYLWQVQRRARQYGDIFVIVLQAQNRALKNWKMFAPLNRNLLPARCHVECREESSARWCCDWAAKPGWLCHEAVQLPSCF